MDLTAKRELATAILETCRLHNDSYQGNFRYGLGWYEAAEKGCADPDLAPLVYAMCAAGFCDFPEWAERQLGKLAA